MEFYQPKRKTARELTLSIRPHTTDLKAIQEVIEKDDYQKPRKGFRLNMVETWIDAGANIGAFSVWAGHHGCRIIPVEPEAENLDLLRANLAQNGIQAEEIVPKVLDSTPNETATLFLANGTYNKYRHSVHLHKRRTQTLTVQTIDLERLMDMTTGTVGVKLDIEGSEIRILEEIDVDVLRRISMMVFEYTFDVDPSIPRFLKIIERLKTVFDTVHYTKVKPDQLEYRFYPPSTHVYCW